MSTAQYEDVVALTQKLVQIPSTNTTLSLEPGTGERAIADFLRQWFIEHDFELLEVPTADPARPSVLAVKRGRRGSRRGVGDGDGNYDGDGVRTAAKSLLFNGHIDTVSLAGYRGDALSGEFKEGRIYGRGSADMKGGLAAAMIATANANADELRGDVWIAAVADEEDASRGSYEVLKVCPDDIAGAIFPEPTEEGIIETHRGFVWFDVVVTGKAAHGSKWAEGVDAIAHMGLFLAAFKGYCDGLLKRERHPLLGFGSAHCGKITGGEETSTYPASATVTVERRTLPGESDQQVLAELTEILERVRAEVDASASASSPARFEYTIHKTLSRPPLEAKDGDLVKLAESIAAKRWKGRHAAVSTGSLLSEQHIIGDGRGDEMAVSSANVAAAGGGGDDDAGGDDVTGKRCGGAFWCDAALFSHIKGIESIVFGPKSHGIHTEQEWVDATSLRDLVGVYGEIIGAFCA